MYALIMIYAASDHTQQAIGGRINVESTLRTLNPHLPPMLAEYVPFDHQVVILSALSSHDVHIITSMP